MTNTKSYLDAIMFRKTIVYLMLTFVCFIFIGNVSAQLNLDTTFNGGVSDAPASVSTSVVQPDGKMLIGGSFNLVNGTKRNNLARLNADGTLDTLFNTGGNGPSGSVFEIIILPDSKLLIGGSFATYNGIAKAGLVRLNSDGSLDDTFNQGGTGVTGTVQTIAIQTDGKILISGSGISAYNGTTRFSVVRINTDGTLDTSFTSAFTSAVFVEEVDAQADGKILIGGSFSNYGGVTRRGVARLNNDGALDTSFNPEDIQRSLVAMTLQPDGKILIGGGFVDNQGSGRPLLARLNVDGSTDASFTPPTLGDPVGDDGFTEYFAIQPDGKILIAGKYDISNLSGVSLLRLNTNGTLDNTFTLQTAADAVKGGYHVRLQSDGKIILVGSFLRFGNSNRNGIVRLNSDGSIDNSFNVSITSHGTVNAIVQQSDGKILVGGMFRTANGSPYTNLARFYTDGTLDASFNIGTGTERDILTLNSILAIAVQPDGKVLVGGRFGSFNGTTAPGIIRLNANGSVDTSFNVTGVLLESINLINDIFVQSDGKVLVGGQLTLASNFQNKFLLRLNSDGSVDSTFNSGNTGPSSMVIKIARRADGKFIIGGAFSSYNGTSRNRIALINLDGTLDTTFNPGTGANSTIQDIVIQPDGNILIGGLFTSFNGATRNRIARLNSDGSLDTSFDPGTGADNRVNSIAFQSDGKIFIGGQFSNYNGNVQNRLARLNANGSIDLTFVSGLSNNPIFFVRKILFQTDEKLLLGGTFNAYNGIPRSNLARLSVTVLSHTLFDFDGDGKADVGVFRPSNGVWYLQNSTSGFSAAQFGISTDRLVPADYDDDGKTDIAVFRDGVWYWLNSSNSSFNAYQFGIAADIPVPADYTGDGRAELAVYRGGIWYTLNLANNQFQSVQFGISSDKPVPADFDADGKTDFAVYRDGIWYLLRSSQGFTAVQFGIASDKPTVGDYDGDAKADQAVYRSGVWYVLGSRQGFYAVQFGLASDIPVAADYDGDGKTDIAVYRNGVWYLLHSQQGFTAVQFGIANDKPIPAAYVP